MRVGVTGHRSLDAPPGWDWVRAEMDGVLAQVTEPITGITSLAVGTDCMFAELVLRHRGSLEAVIPFPGYEFTLRVDERPKYVELLGKCSKVMLLQKRRSDEESYLEAGKTVVDLSELLLAVWDCEPARGLGGTGDIVRYAMLKQKDIIHLNPVEHSVSVKSFPSARTILR